VKIIVETADPGAARYIAEVSRSHRVYSRNEAGSVGPAVEITSITIEATPDEIKGLAS
jgi:hypothetical protein